MQKSTHSPLKGNNMKKTKGLIAAPLTGYNPDGKVNLDIVPQYAKMLHANGVNGAFVNGTTGEGMSLTREERLDLVKAWVDAAPDGFRVIAHVGHTSQKESQTMARHAMETGADAIGEIGPVFFKPDTVDTLADYCAATASAAPDLPYYYYHMPSMNQVDFPMVEFLEQAAPIIPNLAGIKYTHNDLDDYEQCVKFDNGKFDILFGRDELLIESLKRGAKGAVGSTYNILAPLYKKLIVAFNEGNEKESQKLQDLSITAIDILCMSGGFFSALKCVMRMVGLDLGEIRQPQPNLSSASQEQLKKALNEKCIVEYLNIKP